MLVELTPRNDVVELRMSELATLLDGLPKAADNRRRAVNLDLVRQLGKPACITRLLRDCLADNAVLDTIAGRSYRHVNHFDKIVLIDTDRRLGYRLTLHLWMPPYSETELHDELIHDHRFSFWSAILAGELVSRNFRRVETDRADQPAGQGACDAGAVTAFRQYRYSPEKTGMTTAANRYEFVDEARLASTGLQTETAGNAYHLRYHRIHRVILPTESMVCTLVLRGPRERDFSNVYNTSYPSTDTRSANTMFSRAELSEKLDAVLTAVGRGDRGDG